MGDDAQRNAMVRVIPYIIKTITCIIIISNHLCMILSTAMAPNMKIGYLRFGQRGVYPLFEVYVPRHAQTLPVVPNLVGKYLYGLDDKKSEINCLIFHDFFILRKSEFFFCKIQ